LHGLNTVSMTDKPVLTALNNPFTQCICTASLMSIPVSLNPEYAERNQARLQNTFTNVPGCCANRNVGCKGD
jgi:hypothetical protein